jgi:hypothetical protein
MAKLNIKITKPTASTFRSWFFVLVAGGLLALVAVIDRGGLAELRAAAADGSTGCQMEVTVEELNVRTNPNQSAPAVQTLLRGAKIDATRNVVDGFRELEGGRWAFNQYLTPLPNTNCA